MEFTMLLPWMHLRPASMTFEIAYLLGKDETIRRMKDSLAKLG